MRIKKQLLLLCLLVLFGMATSVQAEPLTSKAATLDYDEYVALYQNDAEKGGTIEWSFEGSNDYVGIEVWMFTVSEYNAFISGNSANGYQLSDGEYYIDSGTFTIPTSDDWYIVFWNTDSDEQSTYLTYEATYYAPGYEDDEVSDDTDYGGDDSSSDDMFYVILGLIVVLGFVGCCLSSIIFMVRKRKMSSTVSRPPITPAHPAQPVQTQLAPAPQPIAPQRPETEPEPEARFCPNCGAKSTGRFCEACGSEID